MILKGGKRKFLKRQRESGIQDRIWAILALSLHNAYYAVFFGVIFSRVITSVNQANFCLFGNIKTIS